MCPPRNDVGKGIIVKLISIGYANYINSDRIISMVSPDSAPIKRIIREAQDNRMLIDATYGRKTRTVVNMDSGHVILSAFDTKTIASRAVGGQVKILEGELLDIDLDDEDYEQ